MRGGGPLAKKEESGKQKRKYWKEDKETDEEGKRNTLKDVAERFDINFGNYLRKRLSVLDQRRYGESSNQVGYRLKQRELDDKRLQKRSRDNNQRENSKVPE
jgi:methyl coenzyme M reductase subunit D